MPQGPTWLHEKWKNDSNAIEFLESRGYTLQKDYCWKRPNLGYKPTPKELEAMTYLCLEWDYGGMFD